MGIQTASQSITNEGNGSFAFKNKIINGDMSVNQRQTTFSAKGAGNSQFLLDRWGFDYNGGMVSGGMTYNSSQSTDAPSGFVNSNAISIQNAFSGTIDYTGTSYFLIRQAIEGYHVQDFGWFTAGAKPVTISFWAKSSVAAPCSVGFRCSMAAQTYGYFTTLTFGALNTWEYKTITVPALKPAGVSASYYNGMNGTALELIISFVGSVGQSPYVGTENTWTTGNLLGSANQNSNFVKTAGASFLFTGVQLEVGSVATPFERRNFGTELNLCQRYYEKTFSYSVTPQNGADGTSIYEASNAAFLFAGHRGGQPSAVYAPSGYRFKVAKRAAPSMTVYGNSTGYPAYKLFSAPSTLYWLNSNNVWGLTGTTEGVYLGNEYNSEHISWVYAHFTASAEI